MHICWLFKEFIFPDILYKKGFNMCQSKGFRVSEGAVLFKKRISSIGVVISIVIVSIFAGIVFVSWHSEQVSENLKRYSVRLEEDGFTIEPQDLSNVNSDTQREWEFFSDFSSYAKQMNVTRIYFDQNINSLYYLTPTSPINVKLETNMFYYNKFF